MGLRQTISEWVRIMKDALDFGPEFPAAMEARHAMFAQESARLQHLLEQTRKASQEKDELIARLQAAGAVTGNMVVDGPAYYIRRANTLDGPFCTSCFQRNHEITRIAPAPKPKDADETSTDWVRCAGCKTPFRSDRISQYLNPGKGAGSDDKPQMTEDGRQKTENRAQKTEDRGQKTELQASPSSVLYHPPSDQEPEPKPPQARSSALWSPSPDARPSVENAKPAPAQPAASPEGNDVPKPIKIVRKPRRTPKRDAAPLEEAPTGETQPAEKDPQAPKVAVGSPSRARPRTRKPRNPRPERTKTVDRPKPIQ